MSNITHTTALLAVSKLKRLKVGWVDKRVDIITSYIEQQQKQEKLLELYRQLVKDLELVIEHDTTDTWDGPEDYEYLEVNYASEKALNTYKQIEEIENE